MTWTDSIPFQPRDMKAPSTHRWYILKPVACKQHIFQATALLYNEGQAIFKNVVMMDGAVDMYYIPIERIDFVMEDVSGAIIDKAKKEIAEILESKP